MSDEDNLPLVSVIIPAYQSPEYLKQAVESVKNQTFKDFEIIVVDDCSGEEYVSRYDLPSDVKLIRHSKRFGAAAAPRNTGICAAAGKYIAFLDQDDIWMPDKLALQVEALEKNPGAGLVFSHYTIVDEAFQPVGGEGKLRRKVPNALKQMIRGCFIRTPSTVLIRRDVVIECGMLDESIIGASDWDLYLRVARNYKFLAIPRPLVLYRAHPKQLHRKALIMRNADSLIYKKTLDWARKERPGVLNCVRRSYCRFLLHVARKQSTEENEPQAALQTIHDAVKLWPWNPRIYRLWISVLLRYRKERNGGLK